MSRSRFSLIVGALPLLIVLQLLPFLARGAWAQSSAASGTNIRTLDAAGQPAVVIDNAADYNAGGTSSSAVMDLKSSDGATTFLANPTLGSLTLGGGEHEGILLLKDDDGTTTTIEVDGRTGALLLGANNEDGDLILYDSGDTETMRIDGETGTITEALSGNGLVKAWARINANGTVASCWRCNPALTENFGPGIYRVNFGPLSSDIRSRPRVAGIDSHNTSVPPIVWIQVYDSPLFNAAVVVYISEADAGLNAPFTLVIH